VIVGISECHRDSERERMWDSCDEHTMWFLVFLYFLLKLIYKCDLSRTTVLEANFLDNGALVTHRPNRDSHFTQLKPSSARLVMDMGHCRQGQFITRNERLHQFKLPLYWSAILQGTSYTCGKQIINYSHITQLRPFRDIFVTGRCRQNHFHTTE
jgi:hypothetical protein